MQMPTQSHTPDPRQLLDAVLEADARREVFSAARFRLVRELRLVCGNDQARVAELVYGVLHGWRCAEDEVLRLLFDLYADAGRA